MKLLFQIIIFLNIFSTLTVAGYSHVIKNTTYSKSVCLDDIEDTEGDEKADTEIEDCDKYFALYNSSSAIAMLLLDCHVSNYHFPVFAPHWVEQTTPPPEVC